MTEPAVLPAPRTRRRWWLLLLILPALFVAFWVYSSFAAQQRLARAIAETDRLDPHWRLDDLQAERPVVPDEENAALLGIAARKKLPPNWNPLTQADKFKVFALKPNQAPTAQQAAGLRDALEPGAAALPEARRLADQPRGRWPAGANAFDILEVARLLTADAELRRAEGDLDGALASCRAIVNCGRSVGDEPRMMPQLMRLAAGAIAAGQAERVLGQGQPSEISLTALQDLLAEEGQAPLMTLALRGERASSDHLLESVQRGETPVKQLVASFSGGATSRFSFKRADLFYLPGAVAISRAAMLERMNKLVEASKLPPEQQSAPLAELVAWRKDESPLVLLITTPEVLTTYLLEARGIQARLRCAAAGLAVERYRRKNGRWPEELSELKDEFLLEVPADPFDGKPLRYYKIDEGTVVYSVGPDRKDDLTAAWKGAGICFRLWNVDRRRQPPLSPAPESRP
jgi:hypothetical protein